MVLTTDHLHEFVLLCHCSWQHSPFRLGFAPLLLILGVGGWLSLLPHPLLSPSLTERPSFGQFWSRTPTMTGWMWPPTLWPLTGTFSMWFSLVLVPAVDTITMPTPYHCLSWFYTTGWNNDMRPSLSLSFWSQCMLSCEAISHFLSPANHYKMTLQKETRLTLLIGWGLLCLIQILFMIYVYFDPEPIVCRTDRS